MVRPQPLIKRSIQRGVSAQSVYAGRPILPRKARFNWMKVAKGVNIVGSLRGTSATESDTKANGL